MGLDVYVGSLSRYYSQDWETVVQRAGREGGVPVEVIGQQGLKDEGADPATIREAVLAWRAQLAEALADSLEEPLDWREDLDAPYFTDKPAWDCYSALLLWAAYAEHPELERPEGCVEDWSTDQAYRLCSSAEPGTHYPNLLKGTEWWLPTELPFVFTAADPSGAVAVFGSSVRLAAELSELNSRTWKADPDTLVAWRRNGAEYGSPLEVGARFAFAVFEGLAREAVQHRLVMKLDY